MPSGRRAHIIARAVAVGLACLIVAMPAGAAIAVGRTASSGARIDGLQAPTGTTLLSPVTVETKFKPAVVHLNSGWVLAFDQNTIARLEEVDGAVRVAVESGNIAYTDSSGAAAVLPASNSMVLAQEGEIQEGERVRAAPASSSEEEELCELQDWTSDLWQLCTVDDPKNDDCEWEWIEVPMSDVPQYLDINSYLNCKDRNPLGLTCECESKAFPWWAVGLGAVGLYIITDDDPPRPASPTTPQ